MRSPKKSTPKLEALDAEALDFLEPVQDLLNDGLRDTAVRLRIEQNQLVQRAGV